MLHNKGVSFSLYPDSVMRPIADSTAPFRRTTDKGSKAGANRHSVLNMSMTKEHILKETRLQSQHHRQHVR